MSKPSSIDPKLLQVSKKKFAPMNQKQINREFFEGHKLPVIFVCPIENGKDMVTVDEAGHIFIWKYDKANISSKEMFEPAHRYRLDLLYPSFKCLKQDRLDLKTKDGKPQKFDFADIKLKCLDQRQLLSTNSYTKFIVPARKVPQANAKGHMVYYFREVAFNSKNDYMGTETGAFEQTQNNKAKLLRVKHSKDRQTIALELVKDHLFGDKQFKTIEIVLFNAVLTKN